MFEALIGEQIGQLLANHLNQLGFRDVVVDEASDAVYIAWEEEDGKSYQLRGKSSQTSRNQEKDKGREIMLC